MKNELKATMIHLRLILAAILGIVCATSVAAQQDSMFETTADSNEIQGYTEPFRSIELSSDETGAIRELNVEEGDFVQSEQVIAKLDDRIQRIQVESAQHQADSRGRYDAARQTLAKRQKMFDLISELQKSGGTSNSEAMRASMELLIAEAKLAEAREEIVDREITLKRAKVQLERRWIRSPFSGVVAEIHRDAGEFLSPLKPEIITLVQVDQLLSVFNLPSKRIASIQLGQSVTVTFTDGRTVEGVIHAVGVQTDGKSQTIPVKVKVDNTDGTLRSGEECVLNL